MIRALAALTLALCAAAPAVAHETSLYPTEFYAETDQPLTVYLSSMETFPVFQTGPLPERVARAKAWADNRPATLVVGAHKPEALAFTFTSHRAGVAILGVTLHPRDIDLEPGKVAEYFAEIDPPAATRAALASGATLHETYTKYAKTIVCVAACTEINDVTRVLGDALEFVPEPSLPHFRLIARGAAAAGVAVTVWTTSGHSVVRTDTAGRFSIPADTHGRAMVSATILRPPATPGARFTSDFATLTFDAR